MAEADVYTKNYISQNHVFADVFNFFIYGGWKVIQPDTLKDESIEEGAVLLAGEENETAQRYRDVLKSCVIKRDAFAYATASNSRPLPVCLCGLWCTTRCSMTDAFAVRTLRVWHS